MSSPADAVDGERTATHHPPVQGNWAEQPPRLPEVWAAAPVLRIRLPVLREAEERERICARSLVLAMTLRENARAATARKLRRLSAGMARIAVPLPAGQADNQERRAVLAFMR